MKKILLIIPIWALLQISSCNYLDIQVEYDDLLPYDSVFHNTRNLQRYLWSIPTVFPDPGAVHSNPYTPGVMATDEGIVKFNPDEFQGIHFVTGGVTPSNLRGFNTWSSMYKAIRRVNILLSKMDEAADLDAISRIEIIGYARFIRAYAYYHMFINFGPLILLGDDVLMNNEPELYYNQAYRSTFDETVDYMCSEFEAAAEMMPLVVPLSQFGRPTRGAAWGLVARLRLIQASPAYNGGDAARRYFGGWKRSTDGVNYIPQVYDERKWAVAAAACERIINTGLYKLHTVPANILTQPLPPNVPTAEFPNGVGGIDPYKSYAEMFNGESVAQTNPEYLWAQMSGATEGTTKHSFAKTLLGGWNGMGITQKVIDAYRMADGKRIDEASDDYPYIPDQMYQGGPKNFSGYYLNNNISGMYANRELRCYACVGFSKRYWTCLSSTESQYKNLTITYHQGGNADKADGGSNSRDYQMTGYTITKYIHPDDAYKGNGSRIMGKAFPIIRYAEILLSYVEAMNNLTQSHTVNLSIGLNETEDFTVSRNEEKMLAAFNPVHFRVGLPGLSLAEVGSESEMQKILEQERMVEFLFENRRYFDVRRWGI
ncbi:MAG: RagB/SusD family nutrient uptake outer membrane protein, partial [Prevotellaceae bacterium]|nr:RagB/SusD family nutrient uptake outer membrane protein [Prevotellaceae bacterium]